MAMNEELNVVNGMTKLLDDKNKSLRRVLSKRKEYERNMSLQRRCSYANTGYIAYVHINCMNDEKVKGKASYLLSKYRYCRQPRKHIH